MASSSAMYTLLQYGDDPFKHAYTDLQGNAAFTINEAMRDPNKIIRLIREEAWSNLHSSHIMGPDKSYFFFGAEDRPGYVVYGNSQIKISMEFFLKPGKKEGSTSRYFLTQSRQQFKWKIISTHRMECQDDKHRRLAVWEVSPPGEENFGRLVLSHASLSIVTEVLTSLTLNRMAQALGW